MSEVRKVFEDQVKSSATIIKLSKFLGWTFVVTGALCFFTIVGIPLSVIFFVLGYLCIKIVPKIIKAKFDQYGKAASEAAEIHEYNLKKARSENEN